MWCCFCRSTKCTLSPTSTSHHDGIKVIECPFGHNGAAPMHTHTGWTHLTSICPASTLNHVCVSVCLQQGHLRGTAHTMSSSPEQRPACFLSLRRSTSPLAFLPRGSPSTPLLLLIKTLCDTAHEERAVKLVSQYSSPQLSNLSLTGQRAVKYW